MADLNALALFAKVVEANGFSEAARRLKMPVSTLSRHISDLEDALGVKLLERSTRHLRPTEIGMEVLVHASRAAELSEAVESVVSDKLATVNGTLRLSAPPSISDTLLAPIVLAFQSQYPNVRVQVLVTDRFVDHVAEGVDLVFRLGNLRDSSLIAQKIFHYRHRLVASPDYLRTRTPPESPNDLLGHRLLSFDFSSPIETWTFRHRRTEVVEALTFQPQLSMNDYAGLAEALLAGWGIGDLPPVVQPDLFREGRLVEVMPDWQFPVFDLSLVHVDNRHTTRPLRVFKQFALEMARKLFPDLPT